MIPSIDLHCDTLYRLGSEPERFFVPQANAASHIFYPGLCSAGTLVQCFALFTDLCEHPDSSPLLSIREQFTCFRHILTLSGGRMLQIRTSSQLTESIKQKKIGALLSLEESCLSESPASLLSYFFSLGVRIATLTWDYSNLLATSALHAAPGFIGTPSPYIEALLKCPSPQSGLTSKGIDFLEEAEHLGIILDVSHLSDAGFHDIAMHCKRPFLASHSNARAVCGSPRNLSDSMLRILAERGGLTGLCLHEPFLSAVPCSDTELAAAMIQHAKHIRTVAGADVLALGTDFDGTPGNRLIPDITGLSQLERILKKAGFSSDEIEKVFYKNALRFLKENLPA
ncbi:MAG: membrane dipeptidase [Lachnospiraceae bacterium]|nr:membrane dipeptidase [Lachnospiraceae bacterium]